MTNREEPDPQLKDIDAQMSEAALSPARTHPLAAMMIAGQMLQGGEIVQLMLRPSLWLIPLISLKFLGCVAIALIASKIYDDQLPGPMRFYVEAAMIIAGTRLFIATMQWYTRLYILTDRRVMQIGGIFRIQVIDCPLRRVAVARACFSTRERITRIGTIEIIPQEEPCHVCIWQMVARPREVLKIIRSAIARCRQSGYPGN